MHTQQPHFDTHQWGETLPPPPSPNEYRLLWTSGAVSLWDTFYSQEVKRELRLAEKIHVRNEIANSRGNTNATWKILNRCMSRGVAKRPSTLEDHETLANKFNK